jgi:MIP family channel proteins
VLTLLGPISITIVSNANLFPIGASLGLGFIGFAHGIAIMIGIATVGHISGGHFNPAVTIGLASSGRFPKNHVLYYIIAQLIGAVLASITHLALVGINAAQVSELGNTIPNAQLPFPIFAALLAEIVGTLILVMTVLGSTDSSSNLSWSTSSIGLSIAAVIWGLGAISGASLNPARTFGPSVVSLLFDPNALNWFWIYAIGPILGGLLAAALYRAIKA